MFSATYVSALWYIIFNTCKAVLYLNLLREFVWEPWTGKKTDSTLTEVGIYVTFRDQKEGFKKNLKDLQKIVAKFSTCS